MKRARANPAPADSVVVAAIASAVAVVTAVGAVDVPAAAADGHPGANPAGNSGFHRARGGSHNLLAMFGDMFLVPCHSQFAFSIAAP